MQKQPVLFKKRFKRVSVYDDKIFRFHSTNTKYNKFWYVFLSNSVYLELKFYRFFFLKLRKLSRRKKFLSLVFIYCNHCFSKKARNARMGKGKGKFVRYVCKKRSLKPIFIFTKISLCRVYRFISFLNKKTTRRFFFF
jgi:hypothetical protein